MRKSTGIDFQRSLIKDLMIAFRNSLNHHRGPLGWGWEGWGKHGGHATLKTRFQTHQAQGRGQIFGFYLFSDDLYETRGDSDTKLGVYWNECPYCL